jgi:transposase
MAYRYGQDRNQMTLFPQSIDQYVSGDHPVRAYDAFVDTLDFKQLGISINTRKVGNSQYDPQAMLKLLLYGYSYGIRSSRKLEREVYNNLSFIWLMKNLKPDHKTIAEFRRKNKAALKHSLKLCAQLCIKLDLISGNTLFVDSTKIRANAGKANQHKKKWYQEQLAQVEQRINQILDECDQVDADEAQLHSMVKMPKELAKSKKLKETIQAALAEFETRGTKTKNGKERSINRTDPKSNIMKGVQGTHPSYAVHNVVDDKNGLIAHTDTVNDANDSNQLAEQVKGTESDLGRTCKEACADAGYSDIDQIDQIETDDRKVIVPSPRQVSHKEPKAFNKREFAYDAENDRYICPEGHCLVFRRYQNKEKTKRDYRIEKPALCRACINFGKCTRSKQGRTIVRHINEELREKVEARYCQPEGQQIYKRRKSRVEHPFGYMKKNLGVGQFLLRGIQGAKAEASLVATCFNLTRMISLLGGVQMFITKLAKV